jgi:hypothetical protein
MSISKEARRTMSHVLGAMRPEPPEDLTEEQGQIWREITADLPSARVSGLDAVADRVLPAHQLCQDD